MAILNFVAEAAELGFKRRNSSGFKTFDRRMCEKREEETSLIFVNCNISLSGLSLSAKSAVEIESISKRAGREIARCERACKPC